MLQAQIHKCTLKQTYTFTERAILLTPAATQTKTSVYAQTLPDVSCVCVTVQLWGCVHTHTHTLHCVYCWLLFSCRAMHTHAHTRYCCRLFCRGAIHTHTHAVVCCCLYCCLLLSVLLWCYAHACVHIHTPAVCCVCCYPLCFVLNLLPVCTSCPHTEHSLP